MLLNIDSLNSEKLNNYYSSKTQVNIILLTTIFLNVIYIVIQVLLYYGLSKIALFNIELDYINDAIKIEEKAN